MAADRLSVVDREADAVAQETGNESSEENKNGFERCIWGVKKIRSKIATLYNESRKSRSTGQVPNKYVRPQKYLFSG